jgi:acetate kinase
LGLELDDELNGRGRGARRISVEGARVPAWVVPTDEERMVARHTQRVLRAS